MSLQAKTQRIASFLPANKQIFVNNAQFETVQEIPISLKEKYFDQNIKQIAKMFAEAVFADKQAQQIQETDVIVELQDWLSSGGVKFHLQKKTQPKPEHVPRNPQLLQHRTPDDQQAAKRNYNQQSNLSPRPQRQQPPHQYPNHSNNGPQTNYTQSRPQAYYQTPPPQGRPTAVKYAQRQPQSNQTTTTQATLTEQQQQLIKRQQQYEKQNYGWIDSLSRCLTYPERRFYIMPEMHCKRKF